MSCLFSVLVWALFFSWHLVVRNKTRVVRDFLSVDSMNIKTLLPRDYEDFFFSLSQFGSLSNNLVIVNTGSHGNLWIYAEWSIECYTTEVRGEAGVLRLSLFWRGNVGNQLNKSYHMCLWVRVQSCYLFEMELRMWRKREVRFWRKRLPVIFSWDIRNHFFYLFMGTSISDSFWRSNLLT